LEKEKISVSASLRLTKLACSASHFRVWKEVVAHQLPCAIVLEDDVAIRHGFGSFVQRLKTQLPADFDLVHLYVSSSQQEWMERAAKTDELYVRYIPKWGRSAYLISCSGAQKLILGFQTIIESGDVQISQMARRGDLSVYCASKAYVDNLGQLTVRYKGERFPSTIW
jgi:GR25 family glycosyltransferase involved in LPS biosynthesis